MAGVYVHIPLCASKCAYCDFYSLPLANIDTEALTDSIINEYLHRRDELSGEDIKTLYLGGGTPSSLPKEQLTKIIRALKDRCTDEISVEVNPEDVDSGLADALVESGVNRVSMGVQSLIDSELEIIGRRHSAAKAIEAVNTLRRSGVSNISLDLIYGLPGQTLDSWQRSLNSILDIEPQHLSAYLLSYEKGTRLSAMRSVGKVSEAPEELVAAMYDSLCETTRNAGFQHYEISNFSLPGYNSRHNSSYWDGTPYLGLGPGAHSFTKGIRRVNPAKLSDYLKCRGIGFVTDEPENESERFNDFIITSLRTARGLDLDTVERLFGRSGEIERLATPHIESGAMLRQGRRIRIAEPSWLIADSIMIDFIEV